MSSACNCTPFSVVRLWRYLIATHLCDAHSCIFYTPFSCTQIHTGCRSLYKLSFCTKAELNPRRVNRRATQRGKEHTYSSSQSPSQSPCNVLDCSRKPEYLVRTHTDTQNMETATKNMGQGSHSVGLTTATSCDHCYEPLNVTVIDTSSVIPQQFPLLLPSSQHLPTVSSCCRMLSINNSTEPNSEDATGIGENVETLKQDMSNLTITLNLMTSPKRETTINRLRTSSGIVIPQRSPHEEKRHLLRP